MLVSPVGMLREQLDTPALLIDLDALDFNIELMAQTIARSGKQWRPHAKGFKTPALAHRVLAAGAIGVTVAKVSEAEVYAAAGVRDILIAHILVGRAKADRLAALQRTALVRTTVDHPDQLAWLSDAAQSAGTTIGVLVDLDIGLGRTGVRTVEAAVDLGRRVAATRGLRLDGLMGYEGHALYIQDAQEKESAIAASISRLVEGRDAFRSAGLPCPIVSAGGSGSYQLTSRLAGVTELQAGGGIFACPYYFELCQVERHRTAIFILTSVVSRPQPDHIICDAGLKALSNFRSQPRLPQFPQARLLSLSAEHSTFEIPPECVITLGDKLQLVPGYSDLTIFLHDWMLGLRGERVETVWPLLARGALQ